MIKIFYRSRQVFDVTSTRVVGVAGDTRKKYYVLLQAK